MKMSKSALLLGSSLFVMAATAAQAEAQVVEVAPGDTTTVTDGASQVILNDSATALIASPVGRVTIGPVTATGTPVTANLAVEGDMTWGEGDLVVFTGPVGSVSNPLNMVAVGSTFAEFQGAVHAQDVAILEAGVSLRDATVHSANGITVFVGELTLHGSTITPGASEPAIRGKLSAVQFASGTNTVNGDIITKDVAIAPGATLVVPRDAVYEVRSFYGDGTVAVDGTLDLMTSHVTLHSGLRGAGIIRTTIGDGVHGHFTNHNDWSAVSNLTVVPTGAAQDGGEYVFLNNFIGAGTPEVEDSFTVDWTVTVADSDGVDAHGNAYAAGSVLLTARHAITLTQSPTAGAAAGLSGSPNTGARNLASAVQSLGSADDIDRAARQLRADNSGSHAAAVNQVTTQVSTLLAARHAEVRTASAGMTGVSTGDVMRGLSVWSQGFGTTARQDRRSGIDGYRAGTAGGAIGVDTAVSESVRIGASFSYARTDVANHGNTLGSGSDVDSMIGSLYGTWQGAPWFVEGALSYGRHAYDTVRQVAIGGFTARPTASFDGTQFTASLSGGHPFVHGNVVLTPMAGVTWSRLSLDGFQESGTSGAELRVDSQTYDSLRGQVGATLSTSVEQDGLRWTPEVRATYGYDVIADRVGTTQAFIAGGPAFATQGARPERHSLTLGTGVTVLGASAWSVSAEYDAEMKSDFLAHTGRLTARMEF